MMTRETLIAIALGGLMIAGTPFAAANAQSGDVLAREAGGASRTCLSHGLDPHSQGYSDCADTVQALGVPDDTRHVAVARDSYGFGYDREGNLLDSGGYVIRPVPLSP
jgi:hypothetical protein